MKLHKALKGIPIVLVLSACTSTEEIKPVTHNFSNSASDKSSLSSHGQYNKAKEITVLTATDKSADKDRAVKRKSLLKDHQKKYEVDGDRWGDARKTGIPKHPRVPASKDGRKGIPIMSWSIDMDK